MTGRGVLALVVAVLLLAGGMVVPRCAAAQSAPGAAASAPAMAPTDAVQQVEQVFQQLRGGIASFAAGDASLAAAGRRTAVTLFGVLLVWGLMRSWVLGQGIGQLLPEFLQPLVILGLSLWALDHLGPVIADSVAALAQLFAGTLMLQGGPPTEVDVMRRLAIAAFDVLSAGSGGGGDWSDLLSVVAHQTLGFLYRLVTALVLLLAGAIAAGVMLVAQVQTALALMFAPVFVPWAMWRPSAFLFNAWLGFLISGAMQSVIAAAVAALSVQLVERLVQLSGSMGADEKMSFVACSAMLLLALLVGFLFMKVPALAGGLVGGPSVTFDGWNSVARATGGLGVVGSAAGAVGSGTRGFGRGVRDGVREGRSRGRGSGDGAVDRSASVARGSAAASRSTGRAEAAGRVTGRLAAAAVDAVSRGRATPAFPDAPRSAAPVSHADVPAPAGVSRSPHQPYRPPSGARPTNRPLPSPE